MFSIPFSCLIVNRKTIIRIASKLLFLGFHISPIDTLFLSPLAHVTLALGRVPRVSDIPRVRGKAEDTTNESSSPRVAKPF